MLIPLVHEQTRAIVHGTGPEAAAAVALMRAAGTAVVAAVDHDRVGSVWEGLPLYASVPAAAEAERVSATVITVDARDVPAAVLDALDADLELIVCATPGVAPGEVARIRQALYAPQASPPEPATRPFLLGPGSLGVLRPGFGLVGTLEGLDLRPGRVGVITRPDPKPGSLLRPLAGANIGVSCIIVLADEPGTGCDFSEAVAVLARDPTTRLIVLCSAVTDNDLMHACDWLRDQAADIAVVVLVDDEGASGLGVPVAGSIVGALALVGEHIS